MLVYIKVSAPRRPVNIGVVPRTVPVLDTTLQFFDRYDTVAGSCVPSKLRTIPIIPEGFCPG